MTTEFTGMLESTKALADELSGLFHGKDMAVVTAALAEAVSRCFAQMDDQHAREMFPAWERAMWGLCAENRAIFKQRMAAEPTPPTPPA